jgi:hypothetical protein
VKPGIGVDVQALAGGRIVAVELAHQLPHPTQAKFAQLGNFRFRPGEQVKRALEQRLVAQRDRTGVGVARTFFFARDEQAAQRRIQARRVRVRIECERHRKQAVDLQHGDDDAMTEAAL